MKDKEELVQMMMYYKVENYPHGCIVRGERHPDLLIRSAIGKEKGCALYDLILQYSNIIEDVAEVGVWRGGSAIMLGELLPHKTVYIFDTFEGIPYKHPNDNYHVEKDFDDVRLDEVVETLSEWPNVDIYKGIFPSETGHIIEDKKFSIVHIDTDMYESYKDCLNFFYDKMNVGGIVLLDDYGESSTQGATIATDEFLLDKPEHMQKLGFQYYFIKQ
jgi:hypothetical protein